MVIFRICVNFYRERLFGHIAAYIERKLTLVSVVVLYFFYSGQSLSVTNLPNCFLECKTHLIY